MQWLEHSLGAMSSKAERSQEQLAELNRGHEQTNAAAENLAAVLESLEEEQQSLR